MYASTRSSTDASEASPRGSYTHLPSGRLQVSLLVNQWATLMWNPPSARPLWGVNTHISNPKRRMSWMRTFKNMPDVHSSPPYHISINGIHTHFLRKFLSLKKTDGQSSYVAVRRPSRYLKDNMLVSGWSWYQKSVSATDCTYPMIRWCHLLSAPLAHKAVLGCQSLRSAHGKNMSHQSQNAWGKFLLSIVTMVFRKW